jgi:4-aminobutyrate aminotransferase-like enzyme/Ser/Thr protein kinase RdoA (MazF antagonist)
MRATPTDLPMTYPSLAAAPRLDPAEASALAREHYGIEAVAEPLPSERDQNFVLSGTAGSRFVLKLANAGELPAMIEAQQLAMTHLATRLTIVPRVLPTLGGAPAAEVRGADGRRHVVWMITWLDGVPLAGVAHRSPGLRQDLGRSAAVLTRELRGFDHDALHREFYWDLAHARRLIGHHGAPRGDPGLAAAVRSLVAGFDRHTAPLLGSLRRSVIHNDLNDHNVLVGGIGDLETTNQRVVGIVDFGDMVHSYSVADLAIVTAYAILDSPDPLASAADVVHGYHAELPLTETELGALFGLVALRLCASVCIAERQTGQRADNAYLAVSQRAIRSTLPLLARVPFRFAEAVFRQSCGLSPVAESKRVVSWLGAQRGGFASVLPTDVRREPCLVLDLGVASALTSGDASENAEPRLTERVFDAMRTAGARVAIGQYDEPRLLYVEPAFATGTRITDEHRTVHLGLDLFAEAGMPVHAPLAGFVHALADNAAPQDYGPVVVLRHATDDGAEFYTLYGHLSRESLTGLRVGQSIARGERLATLGTPAVNGGWTPHLHLQVIADLLDLGCDFPGVAQPNQRAVWRSLCPDPNLIVGVPAAFVPPRTPDRDATLAARRRLLGRNLSVAYHDPLKIVRGWRQYLFDDVGRRYVDAYNNVPHVGHCHPRVVEAGERQMAVLNTNTRYLSDLPNEYAERLAATLPSPLRVCYLLNSASEANELALRLVRAHTRRRDMIVLEGAYHGHTTTLIELSPYKHAGPGGSGPPDWVHVAPIADDYRGAYKRGDREAGRKYAVHVAGVLDRAREQGRGVAGFIAESCPSVGGQIVFPPGYLAEVYRYVRAAGGVCIADEVQTGLGRLGTHCWAFEAQGVVPDIVVMGKPLGNGHPIGAVVTTSEIAASFDNGMEFFSTFGGNTVSCAIGLAVLDVLEEEKLQSHALRIGERMLRALRPLMDRHAVVGDVRGSGLFLGVELVRDRATLEPAGEEASFVANRMRERGVLLGTDGPYHNVLKIRPPMPFDSLDADLLVEALDESLRLIPRTGHR